MGKAELASSRLFLLVRYDTHNKLSFEVNAFIRSRSFTVLEILYAKPTTAIGGDRFECWVRDIRAWAKQ
jgi:hypothetical protein